MFCTQCGIENLTIAKFCNNCGHMLADTTTHPSERGSPEQSDKSQEALKEITVSIEKVATGQEFIIYALRVYVVSICLNVILGDIFKFVATGNIILFIGIIAGMVLALIAVFRLCSGMGYSIGAKIGLVVLNLFPPLSIIALLILNSRAKKILRASGLEVVLFNWGKKNITPDQVRK